MKASNGLNIHLNHYESLLGRASMILGYDITAGNSQLNVYVKTGAIREFSGDTEYLLNNSREKYSFKGNGWNNGVESVHSITNSTHSISKRITRRVTSLIRSKSTEDIASAFKCGIDKPLNDAENC